MIPLKKEAVDMPRLLMLLSVLSCSFVLILSASVNWDRATRKDVH